MRTVASTWERAKKGGWPSSLLVVLAIVACLMIASISDGNSDNGGVAQKPAEVVKLFCRLDLDGALLSTENSRQSGIFNAMILPEGPFPGWDTATLVAAYQVQPVSCDLDTAHVLVRYDVIGEIPGATELIIKKTQEESLFLLRKTNGAWKIVNPDNLLPHVSVDTAIKHLQSLVATGGNTQPEVAVVIKKLQELK